jgi:NAD(P)-dependent dehydrogenase (short-subunit alcohol dehydrogenase family)
VPGYGAAMPAPAVSGHVLVTGAGSGIGRAIARRLAADGAAVSLLGRTLDRLEATSAEIVEAGGRASAHAVDVRDREAVEAAMDEACGRHGSLSAAIANAGAGGPNEDGPDDRFEEIVTTNVGGTYRTLRAAARRLRAPEEGPRSLVATSSVLARIGVPGYTAYCASKAAVLGLVRSLAVELAPAGITVNGVCPGWVDTEMSREGIESLAASLELPYDDALARAMTEVPMGRMSRPEEIAGTVAWLVSADARMVTGQGIDVNGGAYLA